MTEGHWFACGDTQQQLDFLQAHGGLTERQARLLAAALCRRVWQALTDERSRGAVEVAEEFAEGRVGAEQLSTAHALAEEAVLQAMVEWRPRADGHCYAEDHPEVYVSDAVWKLTVAAGDAVKGALRLAACRAGFIEGAGGQEARVMVIRCIVGILFRPPPPLDASLLTWNGGLLGHLAQAAYEDRILPSGQLDPARLAVLADALEEAGYPDAALLGHLRSPGPHVRGCQGVDLCFGRL